MNRQVVTRAEIAGARHTARQLRRWGVQWPPPKGWRKALLAGEAIPEPPAVRDPPDPRQTDLFAARPGQENDPVSPPGRHSVV